MFICISLGGNFSCLHLFCVTGLLSCLSLFLRAHHLVSEHIVLAQWVFCPSCLQTIVMMCEVGFCSSAELFWLLLFTLKFSHQCFSLAFHSYLRAEQWSCNYWSLRYNLTMNFRWGFSLGKHLSISILYLDFGGFLKILITLVQAVLAMFQQSVWPSSFPNSQFWVCILLCSVFPSTIL